MNHFLRALSAIMTAFAISSYSSLLLANVVSVDSQNFNPSTSGLDFVTVQSSKTLAPGVVNIGVFANYALNTLPSYNSGGTSIRLKDSLLSGDLNIGLGLTSRWDIGLSLPQVLSQSVDRDNPLGFSGQYAEEGLNEIRINTKYRIWQGNTQGLAIVASLNQFFIENYPFTGHDPGPTINLQAAYDYTAGKWSWGANFGRRLRNPGEPVLTPPGLPEPFQDQWILSVAGSYYFESYDFKLIGEIFGSLPVEDQEDFSDRELSSAELLLGGKWDLPYDVALHFGAGTEIFHGTASPDLRIYAGLNWNFGPLFGGGQKTERLSRADGGIYFLEDDTVFERTSVKATETLIASQVLFDFNGYTLNPEFELQIKSMAGYLLRGKVFRSIQIVGHTDSVGKASYNKSLSLKRANATATALKRHLPKKHHNKISTKGAGEVQPVASNANYQGRAQNRRVEFNIKR